MVPHKVAQPALGLGAALTRGPPWSRGMLWILTCLKGSICAVYNLHNQDGEPGIHNSMNVQMCIQQTQKRGNNNYPGSYHPERAETR